MDSIKSKLCIWFLEARAEIVGGLVVTIILGILAWFEKNFGVISDYLIYFLNVEIRVWYIFLVCTLSFSLVFFYLGYKRYKQKYAILSNSLLSENNASPIAQALVSNLLERKSLFENIKKYVFEKENRVTVLVGVPGVGKSYMSLKLAMETEDIWDDGVHWITSQSSASLWDLAILNALEIENTENESKKQREIIFHQLRNRRSLIILDDVKSASHVIHLIAFLKLHASYLDSRLLITTRNQQFNALANINLIEIDVFNEHEALDLLKLKLGSELIEKAKDDAYTLVKELGYLPIAVDTAANIIKHNAHGSITRLVSQIQQQREGIFYLTTNGQSIEHLYEIAISELDEIILTCLKKSAIFAGRRFSIDALSVAIDLSLPLVRDCLNSLYQVSLLQKSPQEGYYKIHSLLYKFLQSRFALEVDQIPRDLVFYYAETAKKANNQMDTRVEYLKGSTFWEIELDNIVSIIDYLLVHSNSYPMVAFNLILPVKDYLSHVGGWQEAKNILFKAKRLLDNISFEYSYIIWLLADVYKQQGTDISQALKLYSEAEPALSEKYLNENNWAELGVFYRQLGDAYRARGIFEQSLNYYKLSEDYLSMIDNTEELGELWSSISELYIRSHQAEEAQYYWQKAKNIAQDLNDIFEILICTRLEIEISTLQDDQSASEKAIEKALNIIENVVQGDRTRLWILIKQSEAYRHFGKISRSVTIGQKALQIAKNQNTEIGVGLANLAIGKACLVINSLLLAERHFLSAGSAFLNGGSLLHEAETYVELAKTYKMFVEEELPIDKTKTIHSHSDLEKIYLFKAASLSVENDYRYLKKELEQMNCNFEKPLNDTQSAKSILSVASSVGENYDTLDALNYAIENRFKGFQVYVNHQIISDVELRNTVREECKNNDIKLITHAPDTLNWANVSNQDINKANEAILKYENDTLVVHHFDETISLDEAIRCLEFLNEQGVTTCLENFFILGANSSEECFRSYLKLITWTVKNNVKLIPVFDIPRLYDDKVELKSKALGLIEEAFNTFLTIKTSIILHLIDGSSITNRNEWCPIGQGIVPYSEIFDRLNRYNIPVYMTILEYDDKQNPIESIPMLEEASIVPRVSLSE